PAAALPQARPNPGLRGRDRSPEAVRGPRMRPAPGYRARPAVVAGPPGRKTDRGEHAGGRGQHSPGAVDSTRGCDTPLGHRTPTPPVPEGSELLRVRQHTRPGRAPVPERAGLRGALLGRVV